MMNINIKSTNLELTDAIRDYLSTKLLRVDALVRKVDGVIADVEIGKTTNSKNTAENLFKAEINLQVSGKVYRYNAENADVYAAIDKMKDEIIRIVRKDRERKRDFFKRGSKRIKSFIRGFGRKS